MQSTFPKSSRLAVALLLSAAGWVVWSDTATATAGPLNGELGGEDLELIAKRVDVDFAAGKATVSGDVRVRVGKLKVRAGQVELRYDDQTRVRWARAQQGVQAKLGDIELWAPELTVDVTHRRAELSGGVRVSRGKTFIRARRAQVDLTTRKLRLEQVRGTFPLQLLKHLGVETVD